MAMERSLETPLTIWRALAVFGLTVLLFGSSSSTEAEPASASASAIRPTRESIYGHLAAELQAALGAEARAREALAAVAQGVRDGARAHAAGALQALLDGVVEAAEDVWVTADDAGRTAHVTPCLDDAEAEAQQVVKRAMEKILGCAQGLEDEGERRAREAARLLDAIEDTSKRFVTALEACLKEEEATGDGTATDAAVAPAPNAASTPNAAAAAATTTPNAASTSTPTPNAAAAVPTPNAAAADSATSVAETHTDDAEGSGDSKVAESITDSKKVNVESQDGSKKKGKCEKCRKAEEAAEKERRAQESGDASIDKAGKHKGKKEKPWKNAKKDESGKRKTGDSEVSEEAVEEKVLGKSKGKDKRKNKSEKDGNRKITEDSTGSVNADGSGEDVKDKKSKKTKKEYGKGKEGKGENDFSGEEVKSRKSRQLLWFGESEDTLEESETASEAQSEAVEAEGAAGWPSEGATPEERRVIACLRSGALQPLQAEKTRAYQRLQAVMGRTRARQDEAPACATEPVRKAELKIAAIKRRMVACADRFMRTEL